MMRKAMLKASAALLFVPWAMPATAQGVEDSGQAAPAQEAAEAGPEAPPTPPPNAETPVAEDAGVGEIVVTANRRSENLQDVPISIAAFKGETLRSQGIQSTNDLPQITPGLSLTRTLVGANAFLRGVGTTSAGYSTEAPIATYVDGLYLPNSAAAAFSFNNIERIEILKGPQGTLYGRNTTGGLIHVITREPDSNETSIDASASYANYDTVQLNFYGSTPLGDTLAANFAALYINQADGWGRNVFTGNEAFTFKDVGVQGKLQWRPGPDTKITLRGFYDKVDTDQGNAAYIYPGSVGADGSVFLGEYIINERLDPFATQRQYSVSLKADHDFDFATLTSITGYIDNKSNSLQVQSGNLGQPVPGRSAINLGGFQTARTFSQELQLASARGSDLQWLLGAFYYRDNTRIRTDVYGTTVGTVSAPPLPTRTDGRQKTRSYSAYADATYSFTDATRVTLGLRYTRDEKSLTGTVTPLPGFPNSVAAFPPTVVTRPGQAFPGSPNGIDPDVSFGKLTYRAVLAHDLTPDVHAYASYNRGFKSGGYNPISFTNPPSRPEILDSFEVGVKSRLFDRLLQFNIAAFYYDYKDIQLRSTAPPAPPGGTILFNAASARLKGLDADFVIAPARRLTINGGFVLLDAEYKDFPAGICTTPRAIGGPVLGGFVSSTCDLSGRRLPSAPEFSYTLGVTYGFETPVGLFEANVNDGYKSDYFWEPNNRLKQESFHLINASVTWTAPDPRISLQLFGRNLTDEYYFASAAESSGGNDVHLPAAPRTYGVKARFQF